METSTPANKHHLRFFVNPKQYNTRSLDRRKLRGNSSSSSGKSSLVTINDNDILRDKSQTQHKQPTANQVETAITTTANYCTLRRRSSDLIKNKTKIEYISNVRLDFPSSGSSSSSSGGSVKTDHHLEATSNTNSSTATPSTTTKEEQQPPLSEQEQTCSGTSSESNLQKIPV